MPGTQKRDVSIKTVVSIFDVNVFKVWFFQNFLSLQTQTETKQNVFRLRSPLVKSCLGQTTCWLDTPTANSKSCLGETTNFSCIFSAGYNRAWAMRLMFTAWKCRRMHKFPTRGGRTRRLAASFRWENYLQGASVLGFLVPTLRPSPRKDSMCPCYFCTAHAQRTVQQTSGSIAHDQLGQCRVRPLSWLFKLNDLFQDHCRNTRSWRCHAIADAWSM